MPRPATYSEVPHGLRRSPDLRCRARCLLWRLTIVVAVAIVADLGIGCGLLPDIEKPSLLLLFGPENAHDRVGVVSSDLGSAGRFSLITLDGIALPATANIHSDARVTLQQGRVYVINRLNRDNIQVLDPNLAYLTVLEFSTGAKSNPQDLALSDEGTAFISLYERNEILVVDPRSGAFIGQISLEGFADADGLAEPASLFAFGDRVYAAVQRLDRTNTTLTAPPAGTSYLLEIEPTTRTIVQAHPFPAANPFGRLRRADIFGAPHLITSNPAFLGSNFQIDGGVTAFNLSVRAFRPGLLYSEQAAGGDILDAVIKNETTGYAIVQFQDLSTELQRFDPSTGGRTGRLAFSLALGGYTSGLLLAPNGYLYAAESSVAAPGVVIYDTNRSDARLTPTPVDVGLRPTDLVFIP